MRHTLSTSNKWLTKKSLGRTQYFNWHTPKQWQAMITKPLQTRIISGNSLHLSSRILFYFSATIVLSGLTLNTIIAAERSNDIKENDSKEKNSWDDAQILELKKYYQNANNIHAEWPIPFSDKCAVNCENFVDLHIELTSLMPSLVIMNKQIGLSLDKVLDKKTYGIHSPIHQWLEPYLNSIGNNQYSMNDIMSYLEYSKTLLFLGDAGSGKSTFCKALSYFWANTTADTAASSYKFDMVFYIDLQELNKNVDSSAPAALVKMKLLLESKEKLINSKHLSHIKDKKILWIFDHYDSEHHQSDSKPYIDQVVSESQSQGWPETWKIIVASQPHAYPRNHYNHIFRVAGFNRNAINQYIANFFVNRQDEKIPEFSSLIEKIRKIANSQEIFRLPYYLRLLCILGEKSPQLFDALDFSDESRHYLSKTRLLDTYLRLKINALNSPDAAYLKLSNSIVSALLQDATQTSTLLRRFVLGKDKILETFIQSCYQAHRIIYYENPDILAEEKYHPAKQLQWILTAGNLALVGADQELKSILTKIPTQLTPARRLIRAPELLLEQFSSTNADSRVDLLGIYEKSLLIHCIDEMVTTSHQTYSLYYYKLISRVKKWFGEMLNSNHPNWLLHPTIKKAIAQSDAIRKDAIIANLFLEKLNKLHQTAQKTADNNDITHLSNLLTMITELNLSNPNLYAGVLNFLVDKHNGLSVRSNASIYLAKSCTKEHSDHLAVVLNKNLADMTESLVIRIFSALSLSLMLYHHKINPQVIEHDFIPHLHNRDIVTRTGLVYLLRFLPQPDPIDTNFFPARITGVAHCIRQKVIDHLLAITKNDFDSWLHFLTYNTLRCLDKQYTKNYSDYLLIIPNNVKPIKQEIFRDIAKIDVLLVEIKQGKSIHLSNDIFLKWLRFLSALSTQNYITEFLKNLSNKSSLSSPNISQPSQLQTLLNSGGLDLIDFPTLKKITTALNHEIQKIIINSYQKNKENSSVEIDIPKIEFIENRVNDFLKKFQGIATFIYTMPDPMGQLILIPPSFIDLKTIKIEHNFSQIKTSFNVLGLFNVEGMINNIFDHRTIEADFTIKFLDDNVFSLTDFFSKVNVLTRLLDESKDDHFTEIFLKYSNFNKIKNNFLMESVPNQDGAEKIEIYPYAIFSGLATYVIMRYYEKHKHKKTPVENLEFRNHVAQFIDQVTLDLRHQLLMDYKFDSRWIEPAREFLNFCILLQETFFQQTLYQPHLIPNASPVQPQHLTPSYYEIIDWVDHFLIHLHKDHDYYQQWLEQCGHSLQFSVQQNIKDAILFKIDADIFAKLFSLDNITCEDPKSILYYAAYLGLPLFFSQPHPNSLATELQLSVFLPHTNKVVVLSKLSESDVQEVLKNLKIQGFRFDLLMKKRTLSLRSQVKLASFSLEHIKQEITQLISIYGASIIDEQDEHGETLLMLAVRNAQVDLVELLTNEYGAKVNIFNCENNTALELAMDNVKLSSSHPSITSPQIRILAHLIRKAEVISESSLDEWINNMIFQVPQANKFMATNLLFMQMPELICWDGIEKNNIEEEAQFIGINFADIALANQKNLASIETALSIYLAFMLRRYMQYRLTNNSFLPTLKQEIITLIQLLRINNCLTIINEFEKDLCLYQHLQQALVDNIYTSLSYDREVILPILTSFRKSCFDPEVKHASYLSIGYVKSKQDSNKQDIIQLRVDDLAPEVLSEAKTKHEVKEKTVYPYIISYPKTIQSTDSIKMYISHALWQENIYREKLAKKIPNLAWLLVVTPFFPLCLVVTFSCMHLAAMFHHYYPASKLKKNIYQISSDDETIDLGEVKRHNSGIPLPKQTANSCVLTNYRAAAINRLLFFHKQNQVQAIQQFDQHLNPMPSLFAEKTQ